MTGLSGKSAIPYPWQDSISLCCYWVSGREVVYLCVVLGPVDYGNGQSKELPGVKGLRDQFIKFRGERILPVGSTIWAKRNKPELKKNTPRKEWGGRLKGTYWLGPSLNELLEQETLITQPKK